MTIGEKITSLRNNAGISQETLAEKLDVSRQSVSKWEMDQALPQIDKILQICDVFSKSIKTGLHLQPRVEKIKLKLLESPQDVL